MADIIKVLPLSGLDEKGRDCYIVEINNDIFVLDCGTVSPDKTIPGVDFLLPNAKYLIDNKSRLKGYFITHGHDENMAALKYFYKDAPAPIFCSKATRMIMEKQAEIHGVKTDFHFYEVKPSDEIVVANRKIIFFQTTHNCCYSSGIAIDTDKGYIVYTGDFIVDYSLKNKAFQFDLKQLSKISEKETFLLMAESKTADKPGYCSPKHEVASKIERYFKQDKRLFINCFWQNIFRIYELVELCKKYKKKIYCYNRYSYDIFNMILDIEPSLYPRADLVTKDNLLRNRKEDTVILILGKGEDLYTEISKIVNKTNDDKRIAFEKEDIFLNCALPTPTLEVISTKCIDSIYRTEADVVWIKGKDLSSMHARQDDLKFFLSVLKPKYYLPVRGTYVEMMANAKLAVSMNVGLTHNSVFIIDNGMELVFNNEGKVKIINNEENGIAIEPVIVDGKAISNIGSEVIEDRRRLGRDGVVIIASTVSIKKQRIVCGPDCQMRGFVYVKEAEPIVKAIVNIYIDEVNKALAAGKKSFTEVEATIKDRVKKFIKRENGREPLVHPIVIVGE